MAAERQEAGAALPAGIFSSAAAIDASRRGGGPRARRAAAAETDVDAPAPYVLPGTDLQPDLVMLGVFRKLDTKRGAFTAWLRWANSILGGDVQHAELIFRVGGRSLACSVLVEEGVRFKERSIENRYRKPYWSLKTLRLTDAQRRDLFAFCAAQNGKPFNHRGLCYNFLPCCFPACCGSVDYPIPAEQPAWFCSELILAALQHVDTEEKYEGHSPSRTHPQALYELLKESEAFSNVFAYRGNPADLVYEI